MRPQPLILLALLALGLSVQAGPPGPPYFDAKRNTEEKEEAAEAAVESLEGASCERVAELLADPAVQVRDEVFRALARSGQERIEGLLPLLAHKDAFVRAAVAELCAQAKVSKARKALERYGLRARDEETVLEAIWALEAIASPKSSKALKKLVQKGHSKSAFRARGDALLALAACDPALAEDLARQALSDRAGSQRIAGLETLSRLSPPSAHEAAVAILAKESDLEGKALRVWGPPLTRTALGVLDRWTERKQNPTLARAAVAALIAARGRYPRGLEADLLDRALARATGEALRGGAWSDWWSVRSEGWEVRNLLPLPGQSGEADEYDDRDDEGKKRKGKKKKKKKRKGKKKKDEGPEERGPAADGRVETGGGSRVRFCGIPVASERLLFLQDTSGGMSNNPVDENDPDSPRRIDYSKRELKAALRGLPDGARVNVLFFATTYRSLAPRALELGAKREALLGFVDQECKTPKGKGMTRSNLYDALTYALADPAIDSVFFLSEGGQNEGRYAEGERLLRHLERLNLYRKVQVNCLQVTTKKKRGRFLRELSRRTGGTYYPKQLLER